MNMQDTAFAAVDVTMTSDTVLVSNTDVATLDTFETVWERICALDDIVPNTGVCALLGGHQVAVFRVAAASAETAANSAQGDNQIFAIGNYDPNAKAAVLSRGIIGSLGDRLVVASPIYKQHFDLRTGECLEAPEHAVSRFDAEVRDGDVWVCANPMTYVPADAHTNGMVR